MWIDSAAVFAGAMVFLFALAPSAPFTKELGVCESGAVRDVLAGNIILPHFIPGPIVHVPPLYWWTAALCVRVFGWGEIAFRLPSIIAAAGTCAIIFAWTAATLSRRAALLSVAALLFAHFFIDAARQPRMDAMLAMFVSAAAVLLERAIALRRRPLFVLAAIAIGLGALTKGILGIALPGIAIASYLVVSRRFRELFRFDLIATFAGGLAIGLAWYVAGYEIAGHQFLEWQVAMNLWSRFIPAEAGGASYCVHPFWYFAPHVVSGFIPWSLYLPALVAAAWPRRDRTLAPSVVYAVCWSAAIFILFSLSRGKCLVYILPVFPPLAVLTGWAIDEALHQADGRSGFAQLFTWGSGAVGCGALVICAAIAAVTLVGLPAKLPLRLHPTDRRFLEILNAMASSWSPRLIAWVVLFAAGGVAVLLGIRRSNGRLQAAAVTVIAAAGSWFWFAVMNPALAYRETLKPFANEVMETVPADAGLGYVGLGDCDLYFYSPRPIEPVLRFRCDTEASAPPYLVVRERRYEAMSAAQRACLKPLFASAPVDGNGRRILFERIQVPH